MSGWIPTTSHITTSMDRDVAVIRINREDKLNALSRDMRKDLAAAIRHFGHSSVSRGFVVTGTGRAFSAGEDLHDVVGATVDDVEEAVELFHDITRAVLQSSVPSIAALNGLAVGGACEMTLCFDRRIGTPAAGYFLPENGIGLTVSNGTSFLLGRLVGPSRALDMVLGTARLDATEAARIGLIDEIVPVDQLISTAVDTVLRWNTQGSSTAAHLQLLRPDLDTIETAITRETSATRNVWDSGISSAGIQRFWDSHDSK